MEIKINEEIAKYWPPLEDEKFAILEKSIQDEGLREQLVVWKQTNELLDGNHRKKILDKHKIPYGDKIKYLSFPSLLHAKHWVHLNQQGRRGAEFRFLGCCHIIEQRDIYDKEAEERKLAQLKQFKGTDTPLKGGTGDKGEAIEFMARDVPCSKSYLEDVLYIERHDKKRYTELEKIAHTDPKADKKISVDAEKAKVKAIKDCPFINRKAVNMLASRRTVQAFCAAVEKTKAEPEIQIRVAEYIETDESEGIHQFATGEVKARTEIFVRLILDEKDGKKKTKEERSDLKKFEAFIKECASKINGVTEKIDILLEYKEEFDSEIYQDRIERLFFENAIDLFLEKISQLRSKKNDKKIKQQLGA